MSAVPVPSAHPPRSPLPHCHAGEQAVALLVEAGLDAGARLADVFSQQPSLDLPGGRSLTALSSQTQWAGAEPLSMFLLAVAAPAALLPATSLGMAARLMRGQLVVCTAELSPAYVAGILAQGARSVVCRTAAEGDGPGSSVAVEHASTDDWCGFFAAFYDALLAGRPVADALAEGEQQHPALRGMFCMHGSA